VQNGDHHQSAGLVQVDAGLLADAQDGLGSAAGVEGVPAAEETTASPDGRIRTAHY